MMGGRAERIGLKDTDGTILNSGGAVAEKFNGYFSGIAANIKSQASARRTFDSGGIQQYLHGPCPTRSISGQLNPPKFTMS